MLGKNDVVATLKTTKLYESARKGVNEFRVGLQIVFKVDSADFEFSFGTIKTRLGANPIAVQYPIGSGNELEGIIDLITMKAYYYDANELGAVITEKDIPETCAEKAQQWRHDLVEKAAELDDALMEKYLDTGELGETAEQPAVTDAPAEASSMEDIEASQLMTAIPGDATMTEVGTKLDLARAYIDMGDPDGARSILNEVIEEGGDTQQQEARQLLEELGG